MDASFRLNSLILSKPSRDKGLTQTNIHIHQDLIDRAKNGDSKAQGRLYMLYSDAMLNVAIRMMKNQHDAEDVLQEAFVSAFKNLKSFKFKSTFGAWLKRIVINACLNQLRKNKPHFLNIEEEKVESAEENDDWNDKLLNVEKIKRGIKSLPDGYRVVLSMYLLEGYNHNEIAETLNISSSTSKTQYSRGKAKLRELIAAMSI